MITVMAYAWWFAILVAIAIAIGTNQPILHAFAPMRTWTGLWLQLVTTSIVSILALVQLTNKVNFFGQQPMVWATWILLIYAVTCVGHFIHRSRR